jgi:hypothetical protein
MIALLSRIIFFLFLIISRSFSDEGESRKMRQASIDYATDTTTFRGDTKPASFFMKRRELFVAIKQLIHILSLFILQTN